MKIKVKPPQILGFPHVGIVQLIFKPRGSKMDLHIFQRNSREKVRGRVERGRERTVTERDRDRETVQTETASLAAGMRASKSCSFPSWGGFFFFPLGLSFFHLCSHFPLLWLFRKSHVLLAFQRISKLVNTQGWQPWRRQLSQARGGEASPHRPPAPFPSVRQAERVCFSLSSLKKEEF